MDSGQPPPRTSDRTVGQLRNLFDAAIQRGVFHPDLTLDELIVLMRRDT